MLSRDQADTVNTALTQVIEHGTGVGARLADAPAVQPYRQDRARRRTTATRGSSARLPSSPLRCGWAIPRATRARWPRSAAANRSPAARVPAEIWKKFMTAVTKGQTLEPFHVVKKFPGKLLVPTAGPLASWTATTTDDQRRRSYADDTARRTSQNTGPAPTSTTIVVEDPVSSPTSTPTTAPPPPGNANQAAEP